MKLVSVFCENYINHRVKGIPVNIMTILFKWESTLSNIVFLREVFINILRKYQQLKGFQTPEKMYKDETY